MKSLALFAMLPLLILCIEVQAQPLKELAHPIDIMYQECLSIDSNQTTYGMMMCAQQAEEAWDKELNKNYKELMALLTPEEQAQLREAQRKWLAFRDAEFTFSGNLHYNMEGTMYRPMAADNEAQIVRARALELRGYIDLKTME